jgi:hypothetical protein
VIVPEMPVNAIDELPEALEVAETMSCSGAPGESEKLLGDTLTPNGGVDVICTAFENPFSPVTEICADCVPPGVITIVAGCKDKEKSGGGPD